MVERYRHHYLARDATLPLFPGIREIIVALKESGHLVAVATGKSRAGLDRALGHSGLRPLFDATRCADECRSKPDPQMLYELAVELGVAVDRMLMVGDTTHDLSMASNAGCASLAVSYGAHAERSLEGLGALAIVGSPAQLAAWFRSEARGEVDG
jgi:phosphoglycolate phosphatase